MNWRKFLSSTLFAVLLCMLPLLCYIFFGQKPSSHPEANCFIMHYNSDEPFLHLIYDPLRTDWANYQARELSYILDYVDAKFIYFCVKYHHAHFYSLSAIILLTAAAALIHRNLKKLYPETHYILLLIPPLMYVCAFMNNIGFFRSAKPAVSFLLIEIFFTIAGILKTPQKYQSAHRLIPAAASLLIMPGFDRIGFFTAAVCAGTGAVLLIIFSLEKSCIEIKEKEFIKKPLMIFTFAALASVVVSLIYNYVIAPAIVSAINHYPVSFQYQNFQTKSDALIDGLIYVLKNYGGFFFSVTDNIAVICGIAIIFLLTLVEKHIYHQDKSKIFILLAFFGILAVSIVCATMMISRHPLIVELPVGAYFQVFGTALLGIFSMLILETSSKIDRRFLLTLAVISCMSHILSGTLPQFHQKSRESFHQHTTEYTIQLLNDPKMEQTKVLPTSSFELIKFFRQDILREQDK